jgi:hypothetical protein
MSLNLVGPFTLGEEARVWGRDWYKKMWSTHNQRIDDERLDGYLARKQTHMHKLALILSASRSDDKIIDLGDLVLADKMLESTEHDLDKVFSRIGRSEESLQAERFIGFVRRHGADGVPYKKAYQHIHAFFPDSREFMGILEGACKSGQIKLVYKGNSTQPEFAWLIYTGE